MKSFLQFVLRLSVAFFTFVVIWLVAFFAYSQTFLLSGAYALGSGFVIYLSMKQITYVRTLKQHGLSRREYKYVMKNLKEAKQKISRLKKSSRYFSSFKMAKQNVETIRTVKKIYGNTKKEPKRFFKTETFYYSHLDSLVELSEKYAYLSSQPSKTQEMATSLLETEKMIRKVGGNVKKDLHHMLKDDIDILHFELDVANHTLNKEKKERSALNEGTK